MAAAEATAKMAPRVEVVGLVGVGAGHDERRLARQRHRKALGCHEPEHGPVAEAGDEVVDVHVAAASAGASSGEVTRGRASAAQVASAAASPEVPNAPTSAGPPASPSSRPTSPAPMVWPRRSGGCGGGEAGEAERRHGGHPSPDRDRGGCHGKRRPQARDEAGARGGHEEPAGGEDRMQMAAVEPAPRPGLQQCRGGGQERDDGPGGDRVEVLAVAEDGKAAHPG